MMFGRLFALSLLLTLTLSWSTGQGVRAQAGTEVVRLEVETRPDILISRLNPPIIELSNPFEKGEVLTATVRGDLSQDNPEFYYDRLQPVTWLIRVPEGVTPGNHPAAVRATFSLCSKALGFCFTDRHENFTNIYVGEQKENTLVRFKLRYPN